MKTIEFFRDGKSVGLTEVPDQSSQADRDLAARNIGLLGYNRFAIDGGGEADLEKGYFCDGDGSLWKWRDSEKVDVNQGGPELGDPYLARMQCNYDTCAKVFYTHHPEDSKTCPACGASVMQKFRS